MQIREMRPQPGLKGLNTCNGWYWSSSRFLVLNRNVISEKRLLPLTVLFASIVHFAIAQASILNNSLRLHIFCIFDQMNKPEKQMNTWRAIAVLIMNQIFLAKNPACSSQLSLHAGLIVTEAIARRHK